MRFTTFLLTAVLVLFSALCAERKPLSYPSEFKKWELVKSAMIAEGEPLFQPFGGIHHVYRNNIARKAAQAGQAYPDGSIFVFDLYDTRESDNGPEEGARKFLAVMEKRGDLFSQTGGWGYQAFRGDKNEPFVADARKDCYSCHESEAPRDYIFSAPGIR